jgi:peptide/nickel transport system ATP-binding protein/oligopeptide transport system ATP-binding protein
VEGLAKHFPVHAGSGRRALLFAVDGVSLALARGETLGLVGESGCGKSTLGKVVLGLLRPTAGRVEVDGVDTAGLDARGWRALRRRLGVIFQDPYSSLNPRMSVGATLAEPFIVHGLAGGGEAEERAAALLDRVGLSPEDRFRYPHEFSGGQRQRIGVARALALDPELVVADEPVSSLDVSIQAQILNLLMDLREEREMAYLFISHDLSVIRHLSHRVAVMYLGKVVETAPTGELFARPLHPYTEALLSAVPSLGRDGSPTIILAGDIPSPVHPPPGCRFHTRCPIRGAGCDDTEPLFREVAPGHSLACHYRG